MRELLPRKRQAKWSRIIAVLLLGSLFTGIGQARPHRKKKLRSRAVSTVPAPPSPEVEARIRQEVEQATSALLLLDPANLLANPHVVQAMYFHDGFLQNSLSDKAQADPSLRIAASVGRKVTPEVKARFLQMLREVYAEELSSLTPDETVSAPVPVLEPSGRARRFTHTDAVDLFAAEGTPVAAAASGVVILAQSGWVPDDPFSTSSAKGGNTVIVFNPARSRFYRYAHLETVQVNPGTLVEAGQTLGTVGHTGRNAALPGHGRHLHFEINQFDGSSVRAWQAGELWSLLRRTRRGESAPQ